MIEVFQYPVEPEPSVRSWDGIPEVQPDGASLFARPSESSDIWNRTDNVRNQSEETLAEISRLSFESGRKQGIEEGRQAEREASDASDARDEERRIKQVAELVEQFSQERNLYLQAVEHEVVELALAIAARVLRREAQMDPLLLTGAVRVALGQLSNSTQVKLRVPPSELDLWRDAMEHIPNLPVIPTVLVDEEMRLGDCMLEADLGSVDLGLRAQLGEIERGFFDRIRPQKQAAALERLGRQDEQ